MSGHILDLPPELLELILGLERPSLSRALSLSSVCRQFRGPALNHPVPLHIPTTDECLQVLSGHRIPIGTLCNHEPAMFVKYQILELNLSRLSSAELLSNDYLTHSCNKHELSPHYLEVLAYVAQQAGSSLRQLLLNLDLVQNPRDGSYRCLDLVSSFTHLTFLSVSFTQHIELQQRVMRRSDGQYVLKKICERLKNLKSLYITSCPTDKLVLRSDSLERLHIYRSEFAAIQELRTPKLRKLMFHESLREFFNKVQGDYNSRKGRSLHKGLFGVLFDGCPNLEAFNMVDIRGLRDGSTTREDWCRYMFMRTWRKYQQLVQTDVATVAGQQNIQ